MALRILLVEKNIETANLFLPSLERQGYETLLVRSLRQAMARCNSWRPRLLVVDVVSFGNNGFKVCDSIRARMPGVTTLLLVEKRHASLAGLADGFMTPPYTARGLLYRVKKLAAALVNRELRAGPLRLDPDTRTLYKGEQSFYLRPKGAALLAYFMRNQGRVLTRQELMKGVWDTDYLGDTRTVTVHVRWLRQKIEDDPRHPRFLRSVRRVGYRFEVPPEYQDPSEVPAPPPADDGSASLVPGSEMGEENHLAQ